MQALKPIDAKLLKNDCINNVKADDIFLYIGLPVMSIINNNKFNLINSDQFEMLSKLLTKK